MTAFLAKPLTKLGLSLIFVGLLVGALLWYGNSRYNAGVTDTDNQWKAASVVLKEKVKESGNKADVAEANRLEEHHEKVAEEKQKLAETKAANTSAFDSFFPTSDGL